MANRTYLEQFSKECIDKGMLIEAGWIGLRIAAINGNASHVQLAEMRMAFFAGAQHLYSTLMTIMDADREPTEKDLERMGKVHDELDRFMQAFELKHGITEGNA